MQQPIHTLTDASFRWAAALLQQGQLVALPTETVYGLAADALNPVAVEAIFAIKGRPLIDPLIVHVQDLRQASTLAYLQAPVFALANAFWPGPLTLLLPKRPIVPTIVTAGRASVGLRMPQHTVFQAVLRSCQRPLAAPSANPFGYISPTCAEHVQASFGSALPILDGGACRVGIESTILDLTDLPRLTILRPGPISAEAIEAVVGQPVTVLQHAPPSLQEGLLSPGLLSRHYSPRTSLQLVPKAHDLVELATQASATTRAAYVFFKRQEVPFSRLAHPKSCFWLTEDGNLEEAARQLFHLLRALDTQQLSTIYMETPPTTGLGLALNDRLRRAASR